MKTMNFENSTEYSFWGNVDYASNVEARQKRDALYRELCRKHGKQNVRRSVLKGQMSKYSSMEAGYDGRTGDVFSVRVTPGFANELAEELFGKRAPLANHGDTVVAEVRWFNDVKGYGYATLPDGRNCFAHYTAIQGEGFKTLADGQKIKIELVNGPKGILAGKIWKQYT